MVTCPPVCRGMLLLRPDNTRVAGGSVPALEHARRAAVEVWNRPIGARGDMDAAGWTPGGKLRGSDSSAEAPRARVSYYNAVCQSRFRPKLHTQTHAYLPLLTTSHPTVGRPRGLPSLAALQAEASAAAWQQHAAGDTAGPTASRQDPVRPESGTAAAPPRRYHTEASLACAPGRGIHASLEGQASGGTAPASSRWAGGQEGRQPLRALNTNRNSVARAAASAESVPAPGCEPRCAWLRGVDVWGALRSTLM